MQKYTSKETSINKRGAVYAAVDFKPNTVIFDYGCGAFDVNEDHVRGLNRGITWLGYDKYNRSEEYNMATFKALEYVKPDYIILSNVVNVIAEDEIIQGIINECLSYAGQDTEFYINVYEGDRSGNGTETSRGYQRNEKAAEYIRFIPAGYETSRKGNLIKVTHKKAL